jgi:hypothetical protein
MAAKSTYLDNAFLAAALTNTAYTPPTTVYVALNTSVSSAGTPGTEVSDSNYARQAATFSTPSGGSTANSGVLSFFGAGAAAGPYTIVEVAIYDAITGGHELYFGTLGTSKTVSTGDTVSFAISALSVAEQ